MHHGDAGYDVSDPALTDQQRSMLEFPEWYFNDPPQPGRQDYEGLPWLRRKHPDADRELELEGPSPLLHEGWSGPEILGYSWGAFKKNNEAQHSHSGSSSSKLSTTGAAGGGLGATTAAEQQIYSSRAASNAGFASHSISAISAFWLPDFAVTHSTMGGGGSGSNDNHNNNLLGAAANRAVLAETFAARPDVMYVRTPTVVEVYLATGYAYEEGRWEGSWTTAGGEKTELCGVYVAQWQQQQQQQQPVAPGDDDGGGGGGGTDWLLKAELYSITDDSSLSVDAAEEAMEEIVQSRAASNRAVAAHDVAGQAAFWTEGYQNTTSSGVTTAGRQNNVALVSGTLAKNPDVTFERLADRVEVDLASGLAAEIGRWAGGWTEADGSTVYRSGRFCGQWRRLEDDEEEGQGRWLLNAELYVPERHEVTPPPLPSPRL
jgi:hypothetical protein